MQYMEREHPKYVLKTRFYSNYFTHYSGTDTKVCSQEFTCTLNFSFTYKNVHVQTIQYGSDIK